MALLALKKSFLPVFAQNNDSLDRIWFENFFFSGVPICAILKYIWFRLPGYLNGISFFLGYPIFKFLDNKGIPLAVDTFIRNFLAVSLGTFTRSFLAVLSQSNNSIGTILFKNGFLSGVPIGAILK